MKKFSKTLLLIVTLLTGLSLVACNPKTPPVVEPVTYSVTVEGTGLTVSKATGIIDGTEVTLTIVVPEGKLLDKLLVDGVEVQLAENVLTHTFSVTKDVTAKVTYTDKTVDPGPQPEVFELTLEGEGLTATKTNEIADGTEVTLTIVLPKGMLLDKLVVDGMEVTLAEGVLTHTFKVTKDVTATVTYKEEVVVDPEPEPEPNPDALEAVLVGDGSLGQTFGDVTKHFGAADVFTMAVTKQRVDGNDIYFADGQFRLYTDAILTVSADAKYKITAVSFEINDNKYLEHAKVLLGTEETTLDLKTEFTNLDLNTFSVTALAQIRFNAVTITYELKDGEVIDPDPQPELFEITLVGDGLSASQTTEIVDGSEVTLTIDVPEGKELNKLTVDGTEVTLTEGVLTYTFTVTKDVTAKVTYTVDGVEPEPELYELTLEGEGLTASQTNDIANGTEVTLTIELPEGMLLDKLVVDGIEVTLAEGVLTHTFKVNKDVTATVTYKEEVVVDPEPEPNPDSLTATLTSDNSGGAKAGDISSRFNLGDMFSVTISETTNHDNNDIDFKPDHFRIHGQGVFTVNIDAKYKITKLLFETDDSKDPAKATVVAGTKTGTLDLNKEFANLDVNSFTLTASAQVRINSITITYELRDGEVIDPDPQPELFEITLVGDGLSATQTTEIVDGTEVTLTVVVPEGKVFEKLLVDGAEVTLVEGKYTFNVTKDVTAVVSYTDVVVEPDEFLVTVVGDNLVVTPEGLIADGLEVTLTITILEGKELDKLMIDDLDVTLDIIDNVYTFTITKDVTATVTYKDIEEVPLEDQLDTIMNAALLALAEEKVGNIPYPVGEFVYTDNLVVTYSKVLLETYKTERNKELGNKADILSALMDDFARFAKSLHASGVDEITYNEVLYTWDAELTTQSKYVATDGVTLVKAYTTNFVDQVKAITNRDFDQFQFEDVVLTIEEQDLTIQLVSSDEWAEILALFAVAKWGELLDVLLDDGITANIAGPYLSGTEITLTINVPEGMLFGQLFVNEDEVMLIEDTLTYTFVVLEETVVLVEFVVDESHLDFIVNNSLELLKLEKVGTIPYPVGDFIYDDILMVVYTKTQLESYQGLRNEQGIKHYDILAGMMNDFARFAKTLHDSGVDVITYNEVDYTWDESFSPVSKYRSEAEVSLVSAYTANFVNQVEVIKDRNFVDFQFSAVVLTINEQDLHLEVFSDEDWVEILSNFADDKFGEYVPPAEPVIVLEADFGATTGHQDYNKHTMIIENGALDPNQSTTRSWDVNGANLNGKAWSHVRMGGSSAATLANLNVYLKTNFKLTEMITKITINIVALDSAPGVEKMHIQYSTDNSTWITVAVKEVELGENLINDLEIPEESNIRIVFERGITSKNKGTDIDFIRFYS